jgi:hypothetical protein
MSANHSFPTPEHVVRAEWLRPGFAKIFFEETGRPCHYFTEPDHGPAHDHPHDMRSHVLVGGYVEEVITPLPLGGYTREVVERRPGTSHVVSAGTVHRILSLPAGHCLTHVEPGPPAGRWGFYDPRPDGTIWHRYHDEHEWHPWPRA